MKSIDNRLKNLEAKTASPHESMRVLFINAGETEAEALARNGIDPNDKYLTVQFVSAIDEKL